jgi:hypothetical protein
MNRLNLKNACCLLVQNLLSSRLLFQTLKIKISKTELFPVLFNGFGTLSATFREEHRLRVFEDRVLRRIFGPNWGEVTGGWRELHNGQFRNLDSSPNIITSRMIKSRWIEREQSMQHAWKRRMRTKFW